MPQDARDFSMNRVFGSIKKDAIPAHDFIVSEPLEIKDQQMTDMCTAFAGAAVSEDQEGITLEPAYIFAKTKQMVGNFNEWGADLRTACKAIVKFGALPKEQSPYHLETEGRDFVANWAHWDIKFDKMAKQYAKQSFFMVDGVYDMFDNIRMALWRNKDKKQSVITGCLFRRSWLMAKEGVIPTKYEKDGIPHAFKIYGQKRINGKRYLVAQLSNGTSVGDGGKFYFPRYVVNKEFTFGCYMFVDLPKDQAQVLNNLNLSIQWRWFAGIVSFFKQLIAII